MVFMLYKINDKYYIRIGSKYVEVKLEVKNKDVNIIPINENIIENYDKSKIEEIVFNDDFKNNIIKKNNKPKYFSEENKSSKNNMFGTKSKRN